MCCLHAAIPRLRRIRLSKLADSNTTAACVILSTARVQDALSWCNKVLGTLNLADAKSLASVRTHYAKKLYQSVDSNELRESAGSSASTDWARGIKGPSNKFVSMQRIRTNALPSRKRTSRGKGEDALVTCRRGCQKEETTSHIIQRCPATHGGHCLRHNAVDKLLQEGLAQKG